MFPGVASGLLLVEEVLVAGRIEDEHRIADDRWMHFDGQFLSHSENLSLQNSQPEGTKSQLKSETTALWWEGSLFNPLFLDLFEGLNQFLQTTGQSAGFNEEFEGFRIFREF